MGSIHFSDDFDEFDFLPSGQALRLEVAGYQCDMCGLSSPGAHLAVIGTDRVITVGERMLRLGIVAEGAKCGCQSLSLFRIYTSAPRFERSGVDDRFVGRTILTNQDVASLPGGVYDFRHDFFCGICQQSVKDFTFEGFLTDSLAVGKNLARLVFFISEPPCACSHAVLIGPTTSGAGSRKIRPDNAPDDVSPIF